MVEGSTRLPSGTSLTRYFTTILVERVTLRSIHAQLSDHDVSRPRPWQLNSAASRSTSHLIQEVACDAARRRTAKSTCRSVHSLSRLRSSTCR